MSRNVEFLIGLLALAAAVVLELVGVAPGVGATLAAIAGALGVSRPSDRKALASGPGAVGPGAAA